MNFKLSPLIKQASTDYLEKHRFCPSQIHEPANADTGIIVVIPCHNEPDICSALNSLWRCERPACTVETIIVINAATGNPLETHRQNQQTIYQIEQWKDGHQDKRLPFHIIIQNKLPLKHAGVGLARKIGMDEAVERFDRIGRKNGIIACFDADSTCEPNYLTAIYRHFRAFSSSPGCSVHFEHPLSGVDYDNKVYEGIAHYELFLRYYRQGLNYAGHPYSYHTIGSSMAVGAAAYQQQGGMNKRKAGEDFYFLQKIIPLGNFTELTETTVIPSPRPSDRVPFGTGKSILKWLNGKSSALPVYHPLIFEDLKAFCIEIPTLYQRIELSSSDQVINELYRTMPPSVTAFLKENNLKIRLKEIYKNSASLASFEKRFYQWFNAFIALKYVHYARDRFHGEMEVKEAAYFLLQKLQKEKTISVKPLSANELLVIYRRVDKEK